MRIALACLGIAFALGALAAPAVASNKAASMKTGHKQAMHMGSHHMGSHHKGTSGHRSGSMRTQRNMHMNMNHDVGGHPKTAGLWDFPKADFGVALGLAALIGIGGGFIYAGILGPKV